MGHSLGGTAQFSRRPQDRIKPGRGHSHWESEASRATVDNASYGASPPAPHTHWKCVVATSAKSPVTAKEAPRHAKIQDSSKF
eukprot:353183-Chlamydomonas_euryale.AAC.3